MPVGASIEVVVTTSDLSRQLGLVIEVSGRLQNRISITDEDQVDSRRLRKIVPTCDQLSRVEDAEVIEHLAVPPTCCETEGSDGKSPSPHWTAP